MACVAWWSNQNQSEKPGGLCSSGKKTAMFFRHTSILRKYMIKCNTPYRIFSLCYLH